MEKRPFAKRITVGTYRGYSLNHRAWYAERNGTKYPDITFGLYFGREEGVVSEMSMHWDMDGSNFCHLIVYQDSFATLTTFTDVLMHLGKRDIVRDGLMEADFIDILEACGFRNLTAYTQYTDEELQQCSQDSVPGTGNSPTQEGLPQSGSE